MLSRELDEAIFTLRDSIRPSIVIDSVLAAKLANLLLVAAATGQPIQAVAETVARDIIAKTKSEQGQIELRNV